MQTQDQSSHSNHVVDIGEGDKCNGGQVMNKHEQEVLEEAAER